jgi:uncharacterized repeat protein (TIGR03847 family)
MPRRIHFFDTPDRFVTGTIGEPGSRTFFLQARDGGRVISVALEKVQVAVLADRLAALLGEIEARGIAEVPEEARTDAAPLDEPINEAFRAGTLTLGWDVEAERVVIEAREQTDEDEEEDDVSEQAAGAALADDESEDGPDLLRVRLEAGAARSFIERAVRVLGAGRPPCPLCGQPLDPQGHLCPRRNGNRLN